MSVLSSRTINTFNNKYNVIYKSETPITLDWPTICKKIVELSHKNDFRCNKTYNDIYKLFMCDGMKMRTLLVNIEEEICKIHNSKPFTKDILTINNTLHKYDNMLKNLNYYTSIFKHNKIKEDGTSNGIEECIYEVLSNIIFDKKNIDDLSRELVKQLLIDMDVINRSYNILGIILTNDSLKKEQCSVPDSRYETYMDFMMKSCVNLNKCLDLLYKTKKIDIYQIFIIIDNCGDFYNKSFIKTTDDIIYKNCYKVWIEELISMISNTSITKILDVLNDVEKYINNSDTLTLIKNKFLEFIDFKMETYNKLKATSNNGAFDILTSILNLSYTLLSKWEKYDILKISIIDKLNKIFTNDISMCIIQEIRTQIETGVNIYDKYIDTLISLLKLQNFDYNLTYFISMMQTEYMAITPHNINKFIEMIKIDKQIYEKLNDYISNNEVIKIHLNNKITNYKNIIDDINKSLTYNISFKKSDGINNTSFLLTSGPNNWSETSKHVVNNFEIKYNNGISKMIEKIETFHNKKNPLYKIRWLNDCSTVILNYNHDDKIYNLKLTLLQASTLLLFEDTNTLVFDDIYKSVSLNGASTAEKTEYIRNVCESLVLAKILKKSLNDTYMINDALKLTDQYIKKDNNNVAANIAKFFVKVMETKEPEKPVEKKIVSEIEYDRVNTIKCHIIKFVKKLSGLYHTKTDIFKNIQHDLSIFKFTQSDVDNCIKGLVKSYYLDEKNDTYRYEKE